MDKTIFLFIIIITALEAAAMLILEYSANMEKERKNMEIAIEIEARKGLSRREGCGI